MRRWAPSCAPPVVVDDGDIPLADGPAEPELMMAVQSAEGTSGQESEQASEASETSDGDLMAVLWAVEDADAEQEAARDWAKPSLTRTSRAPPSHTGSVAHGWAGSVRAGLSAKFYPSLSE